MSSSWGNSHLYDDRDRDRHRRRRPTLEVDIEERGARGARPARSVPDFLREDYNRGQAGALVRVPDPDDDYDRPRRRERPRETREEIRIREETREAPPAPRSRIDDDVRSVTGSRTTRSERVVERPRPRSVSPEARPITRDAVDICIRHDAEPEEWTRVRNRGPRDADEVIIRRTEAARSPSSVVERQDITFRRGEVERPRPRPVEKEEITIRRGRSDSSSSSSASPSPPPRRHRETSVAASERIIFRPRERSLPPPREKMIAREHEEFVIRRRRPSPSPSPSPPPPPREPVKEEIIIRRTERVPTPPPPAPAPPPPEPIVEEPPVIRRPIVHEEVHRDIIYHHRHFDHGVEIVRREATPPPPAPAPPEPEPEPVRDEKLEVSIRRNDGRDDIEIDVHEGSRSRRKKRAKSRAASVVPEDDRVSVTSRAVSRRGHSISPPRAASRALAPADDHDLAGEAEFYNRKALERATPGEAYHGATRDWGLVDVPPGTSRVKMEGIGGGAQEISWQRYNGARRSRFIADGHDYVAYPDFEDHYERVPLPAPEPAPEPVPEPPPPAVEAKNTSLEISIRDNRGGNSSTEIVKKEKKSKEMWTEITKDLVIKEAIDEMGYGYEETDSYFYVMDYLQYEDVLRLVEISDNIRRQRRRRLKEIEFERDIMERLPPAPPMGERFYERDIIYERRTRR